MVAARTSDDLLARVKARAQIPATDDRLTNADILAIADDVTLSTLARAIVNADDGRLVRTATDVAIVAGEARYRIPDAALAGALYDVLIVDGAGRESSSAYVGSEEAWRYSGLARGAGVAPYDHTIEGDLLTLLPTPTQSGLTLRLKYRRRPSRLVPVAQSAQIVTVSAGSITATLPLTWTDDFAADVTSSRNADALEDAAEVKPVLPSTLVRISSGGFAASGPLAIAAGDYVCRAGETCVPQIPDVAFPALVALTTVEVLIALGDQPGAAGLQPIAALRVQEARRQLGERNRESQAIIRRWSALRGGGGRRGRW